MFTYNKIYVIYNAVFKIHVSLHIIYLELKKNDE